MRIGADVRPSEEAAMPKAEPCAPAVQAGRTPTARGGRRGSCPLLAELRLLLWDVHHCIVPAAAAWH
eukprot:171309-Prymnesium_polylepis.1